MPSGRIVPETATDYRRLPGAVEQASIAPEGTSGRPASGPRIAVRVDVRERVPERSYGLRFDDRVVQLDAQPVVIGRSPDCQIATDDVLLSRRHAEVSVRNGSVVVSDLHSTNGVYVNGVRVKGEAAVRTGDWISIGTSTIQVLEIDAPLRRQHMAVEGGKPPSGRRKATEPGSPLMMLAGVAERALDSDLSENGVLMLNGPLDGVLRSALNGEQVSSRDAEMAAILASRLAESRGGNKWVQYCFRLYAALSKPLPRQAIDRLYLVFHRAGAAERRDLTRYLEVLNQIPDERLGLEGLALVERISGLAQLPEGEFH